MPILETFDTENSETPILIARNSNIYERSMIITLVRDRM